MDDDQDNEWQDEVEWKITDELDLHTFSPRDVSDLIPDYIDECVQRGFAEVRIIHGKGKGTLRRIVHAALERHEAVTGFVLGDGMRGGWGATIVTLSQPSAVSRQPSARSNDDKKADS